MPLPRTFVGFSSTDIDRYHLMCAWKAHEHIDFNFCDCQIWDAVDSTDEAYIKRRCRERIEMAGTYLMLIGTDTWTKTTYVKWEAEVAIEKGCRLIGVNLDNSRVRTVWCPTAFVAVDALFVPFSPQIIQWALANFRKPNPLTATDYSCQDGLYQSLGYVLEGTKATRPSRPNPFLGR